MNRSSIEFYLTSNGTLLRKNHGVWEVFNKTTGSWDHPTYDIKNFQDAQLISGDEAGKIVKTYLKSRGY